MKRLSYVMFIFFISFSSCNKVDELTKFNLDYSTATTIPASTGINLPFNVFSPDVETDAESEFEINNTRKDLVEEIMLTKLTLDITSPNDQNFTFLKSVNIYISAEGLDEIEVAYKEDIPENIGQQLDLETTNTDIKEYIKKDNFNLRVNTVTDEFLNDDVDIDISSQFHVDAKVLGL